MGMTNYWIGNLVDRGDRREWVYEPTDVLPPGVKIGKYDEKAFYAVEPYVVHAKFYGMKQDKHVDAIVYGVGRENLLIKVLHPEKVEMYSRHSAEGWHVCRFDETKEGWRFVRTVVKLMKVLTSVAKKAAVERRKVERNRAEAKARDGREGTCQICEGRQIIRPTGENKGSLVLHGYRRPGYGFTVGNCYGYHRKPFEVACDALTEWVEMLAAQKASAETALADLPSRETLSLTGANGKAVTIERSDVRWDRAMERTKYEMEANLRAVTREHEYQSARLAAWYKARA